MITNNSITYYHKTLNENRLEEWERYYFKDVWKFGGKGSSINTGYQNNNEVSVRIPISYVTHNIVFAIGDIIAVGEQPTITKQSDLKDIEFYNVTSININDFGNNRHVHLRGK